MASFSIWHWLVLLIFGGIGFTIYWVYRLLRNRSVAKISRPTTIRKVMPTHEETGPTEPHKMNDDTDAKFYLLVAKELAINKRDEALWTMAFALEDGNESATKAHYIRLRVAQMKNGLSSKSKPSPGVIDTPTIAPENIKIDRHRSQAIDEPASADMMDEHAAVVGEKKRDALPLVISPSMLSSSWGWIWPSIIGVLLAKLFGLAGCLVTIGAYYWLKPKLGTWGAVVASGALGVVTIIGLGAMLRA